MSRVTPHAAEVIEQPLPIGERRWVLLACRHGPIGRDCPRRLVGRVVRQRLAVEAAILRCQRDVIGDTLLGPDGTPSIACCG
jgi:hypothetical protein